MAPAALIAEGGSVSSWTPNVAATAMRCSTSSPIRKAYFPYFAARSLVFFLILYGYFPLFH